MINDILDLDRGLPASRRRLTAASSPASAKSTHRPLPTDTNWSLLDTPGGTDSDVVDSSGDAVLIRLLADPGKPAAPTQGSSDINQTTSLGSADSLQTTGQSQPEPGGIVAEGGIVPTARTMIPEVQLDSYAYPAKAASGAVYGSNFVSAWTVATGTGITVGLIDSGLDPTVLQNWSALSWTFVGGGAAPPAGTYHGITTSGVIGAPGSNSGPIGIAPNAIILGLKIAFGDFSVAPFSNYVAALVYGAKNAVASTTPGRSAVTDWARRPGRTMRPGTPRCRPRSAPTATAWGPSSSWPRATIAPMRTTSACNP
jgi:hypothetical protein